MKKSFDIHSHDDDHGRCMIQEAWSKWTCREACESKSNGHWVVVNENCYQGQLQNPTCFHRWDGNSTIRDWMQVGNKDGIIGGKQCL